MHTLLRGVYWNNVHHALLIIKTCSVSFRHAVTFVQCVLYLHWNKTSNIYFKTFHDLPIIYMQAS